MRQMAIIVILILIGLAAGTAIGFLITKPRIEAVRAENEDLNTRLQASETQSQDKIRVASEETAKLRADLMRARNDLTRLNTDLLRARSELAQTQAALQQTAGVVPQAAQAAASEPAAAAQADRPSVTATASAGGTSAPAVTGPTREYVIKDGDSFWKIAAGQLGSGARYKEIIDLNPNIPADKPLVIGTKIKLPPK